MEVKTYFRIITEKNQKDIFQWLKTIFTDTVSEDEVYTSPTDKKKTPRVITYKYAGEDDLIDLIKEFYNKYPNLDFAFEGTIDYRSCGLSHDFRYSYSNHTLTLSLSPEYEVIELVEYEDYDEFVAEDNARKSVAKETFDELLDCAWDEVFFISGTGYLSPDPPPLSEPEKLDL